MKVVRSLASLAVMPCVLAAAFPAFAESSLKETVVTATRMEQPLTDVVADVSIIDRETIERTGGRSVADLLTRIAGIEFMRQGGPAANTEFFLRGADTRFTAVFIDGIRVDAQSGSGGANWSVLPLAQVDRIEVLRGPAAAVYGSDAVAGVVQIFTRRGEGAFSPFVTMETGSHQSWRSVAGFSGAVDVVDYSLALGHEGSQGYNSSTGNPDKDGFQMRSASASLGWKLAPAHRLEATLLSSEVDNQYDALTGSNKNKDSRALRQIDTQGLAWKADWGPVYSTQLSATHSMDRYETRQNLVRDSLSETQVNSYLFNNAWRTGAGLFSLALERREDQLASGTLDRVRSQDGWAVGYGLTVKGNTLQLNARHDRDSEFGDKNTGSAAWAYALAPGWRLTASAGTSFRAPTLYQRFHPDYGNANLQPESGLNREVGMKYQAHGNELGLVVYRNRIENLIAFDASVGPKGRYTSTGHALLEGVTLSGATRLGGVRMYASADFQDPRNLDTGKQLKQRAQEHATLGASTIWAGWTLGADLLLSGDRYNDDKNLVRLAGYNVLNLYLNKPVSKDWTFFARVDNATDRNYTLVSNYVTPGRAFYAGFKWAPQ